MKFTSFVQHKALFVAAFILAALVFVVTQAIYPEPMAAEGDEGVVLNTKIDMTCPSPPPPPDEEPAVGPPPPCILPTDLDPRFISPNPSGEAQLIVKNDNTAQVRIRLDGLADNLVLTGWVAYFQPPRPIPHPIFESPESGQPPVASVAAPLAPTYAGFTEGLGPEPNQFTNLPNGQAVLEVKLDYNPLKAGQGPLRNGLMLTHQVDASPESGAAQPNCCPNGIPAPRPQAVGASFLRVFDPATGFQVLGLDGRPQLLRSPVPVAYLVVIAHIDGATHGISAGNLILPAPDIPASTGDHFTVGIFDLRQFQQD